MVGTGGQASTAEPGLPMRLLLALTTSTWRNAPPLHPAISSQLRQLEDKGWRIREAPPRNFIIWRNEHLHGPPRRLIVLPNGDILLSPLERDAVALSQTTPALITGKHHGTAGEAEVMLLFGGHEAMLTHLQEAERKIGASLTPFTRPPYGL
jgi:hypothetical protein